MEDIEKLVSDINLSYLYMAKVDVFVVRMIWMQRF